MLMALRRSRGPSPRLFAWVRRKPSPRISWNKKPKPATVAIRLNGEPRFRGNRLIASY